MSDNSSLVETKKWEPTKKETTFLNDLAQSSNEILDSIENHAFTLSVLSILAWYIVISATWNMKHCEEFWRYLWFLAILWVVTFLKLKYFPSKEADKESTKK